MNQHKLSTGLLTTTLPTRDQIVILAALTGVTALAWAYLVNMSSRMEAMEHARVETVLQLVPWTLADFMFMGLMWGIMMVGMMLPSAAPLILVHAAVVRKAAGDGVRLTPTVIFASGYLVIWMSFSVGATVVQWALHHAALLSPMMETTGVGLGAGILITAGIYQLTPWKEACLDHCRSPIHFISQHWKPGLLGAFRMGLEHGVYCLGCCWALMGLLFVGGVMNLLWIAGIALFVFIEKVFPVGFGGRRLAGWMMILAGGGMLVAWLKEIN